MTLARTASHACAVPARPPAAAFAMAAGARQAERGFRPHGPVVAPGTAVARSGRRMRRFAPAALACLLGLAPATALGGPRACGDDVDGHGRSVPCDCGDVLVSSHTLGDRDPITRHVCPGPGLLVRIAPGRPAPTLALGGQEVAGSRRGVGIAVVGGGAGGLTLLGPGTVRGFDVGIDAAPRALAHVDDVTLLENASDGLRAGGTGYVVSGCQARRNGRDGFVLHGTGYRVEGNTASENGGAGFRLAGRGAAVAGNRADANGRDGILLRGQRHVALDSVRRPGRRLRPCRPGAPCR